MESRQASFLFTAAGPGSDMNPDLVNCAAKVGGTRMRLAPSPGSKGPIRAAGKAGGNLIQPLIIAAAGILRMQPG
mgnify:CR=1 FL=1